jgi:hypothetical protein
LSEPTRIEAGGKPIDVGAGGAAPYYGDMDGDGLDDLLVGQFAGGKLRFYRNQGTVAQPKFDDFNWFEIGKSGELGQVIAGQTTGFVPQLVDFDGDGLQDILSCSGNGEITLFRRIKDGHFAAGESLKRSDGNAIFGMPDASVQSVDWDTDGDLDLLLANGGGEISLLRNTGSRKQPAYGPAEPFRAGGEPVYGRFRGAAPAAADWDGDLSVDLLVGAQDGSVTLYRHAGDAPATTLEEGKILVTRYLHDEREIRPALKPGGNARPCVCDFNGDGRLDLLVGDVSASVVTPEIKLTEEEREHDAALTKKLDSLSAKFSALRKDLDGEKSEARAKRLDVLRLVSSRMREMRRELYRPPPETIVTLHGHVWVYLRREME